MVVTLMDQQYNFGEKPTVMLYTYITLCRLCVCVFLCSHWSLVDVPLIFFCPADHVPDWQPRVLLGMVEARSVNVKKTTTTTTLIAMQRHQTQVAVFTLKTVLTCIQYLLFFTLQGKETNFRGHKLTQNKVQKKITEKVQILVKKNM